MRHKVAAVIEWPSDAAEAPALFVADSIDELLRPVMESLQSLEGESFGEEDFIAKHPFPDLDDLAACKRWLIAMREHITAVWLNFYAVQHGQVGAFDLSFVAHLDVPHALVTRPRIAPDYCDRCHVHRDYLPGLHVGEDVHLTDNEES